VLKEYIENRFILYPRFILITFITKKYYTRVERMKT